MGIKSEIVHTHEKFLSDFDKLCVLLLNLVNIIMFKSRTDHQDKNININYICKNGFVHMSMEILVIFNASYIFCQNRFFKKVFIYVRD